MEMLALATSLVYNASHDHLRHVHSTLEALGRDCGKLLDIE
jgi:hypothetical protein